MVADRFYLGSGQHHAGLKQLVQMVIMASAPVGANYFNPIFTHDIAAIALLQKILFKLSFPRRRDTTFDRMMVARFHGHDKPEFISTPV